MSTLAPLRKSTARQRHQLNLPGSPVRSRVVLREAEPNSRHCPLPPEELIASPLAMRRGRRGSGLGARDSHSVTQECIAVLGAIALRELASGQANRNEAALPDRSDSQLNAPRLLSRGPHGRERLHALLTVRPDKFPTAIFQGACPPELESRLDG